MVCAVSISAHLQAHVVRQEWEEVMLHVAVDEGMAEGPVQQRVSGKVQDSVCHLVDAFGPVSGRKHGQADVLRKQRQRNQLKKRKLQLQLHYKNKMLKQRRTRRL